MTTPEPIFCALCETFHAPGDVCESNRIELYNDLLATVACLFTPVGEPPGHHERALLFATAQQRLAQIHHLDAIDEAAAELRSAS